MSKSIKSYKNTLKNAQYNKIYSKLKIPDKVEFYRLLLKDLIISTLRLGKKNSQRLDLRNHAKVKESTYLYHRKKLAQQMRLGKKESIASLESALKAPNLSKKQIDQYKIELQHIKNSKIRMISRCDFFHVPFHSKRIEKAIDEAINIEFENIKPLFRIDKSWSAKKLELYSSHYLKLFIQNTLAVIRSQSAHIAISKKSLRKYKDTPRQRILLENKYDISFVRLAVENKKFADMDIKKVVKLVEKINEKPLWKQAELARVLDVAPQTVSDYISKHIVNTEVHGGVKLIPSQEIRDYLRQQHPQGAEI